MNIQIRLVALSLYARALRVAHMHCMAATHQAWFCIKLWYGCQRQQSHVHRPYTAVYSCTAYTEHACVDSLGKFTHIKVLRKLTYTGGQQFASAAALALPRWCSVAAGAAYCQ